jgi:hypothetical protein
MNGRGGFPIRNDNVTNFAYVGTGTGLSPPENYYAYNPADPSSTAAIPPGSTVFLKNKQTGLYCRLARISAGYPLGGHASLATRPQQTSSSCAATDPRAQQQHGLHQRRRRHNHLHHGR